MHADELEKDKNYNVYTPREQMLEDIRYRTYVVLMDRRTEDYLCICAKFQKDGILCSHILKIMIKNDIGTIPEKYILTRWRKKEEKLHCSRTRILPIENNVLRFNNLSLLAAELNSAGSQSRKKYTYLLSEYARLNEALNNMEEVTTDTNLDSRSAPQSDQPGENNDYISQQSNQPGQVFLLHKKQHTTNPLLDITSTLAGRESIQIEGKNLNIDSTIHLQDPSSVQTKGRPTNKRIKPIAEIKKIASKKKKEMNERKKQKYECKLCKGDGHNAATCSLRDKQI